MRTDSERTARARIASRAEPRRDETRRGYTGRSPVVEGGRRKPGRADGTYDRATFLKARQAWIDGAFSSEWAPYQRAAAEAGYIYPPDGSKWDDREAENPSPRAIVWGAIQNRPEDTLAIIRRSRSWGQVVGAIIQTEDRLHEDAALEDREAEYDRAERVTHRESVMALAGILRRIDESRP